MAISLTAGTPTGWIVVTSLYLAGAIPFSAHLANAISDDGDALFPALLIG